MYNAQAYITGTASQGANQVIDHTSRPKYGGIGTDYWTANQWMQWYYALKSAYGKAQAKQVYAQALDQVDFWDMYHLFGYDSAFRNFIIKEDLRDLDSNVFKDAWSAAGSITRGLFDTINLTGDLLPIIGLGLLGYLGYKLLKG